VCKPLDIGPGPWRPVWCIVARRLRRLRQRPALVTLADVDNQAALPRVTVWGENLHEQRDPAVHAIYPDGMHATIADAIRDHLGPLAQVRTATFDQPSHGLTDAVLDQTDVLTWWGHLAHQRVLDDVVERVHAQVLLGMGLIVLHSGHESKLFKRLMGTTCSLRWREAGEREIVWKVNPGHPIARGLPDAFVIPHQEMYGEFFDIPQPDELVFISSFAGGEVFRSGCAFRRGQGRIFYFSPGHETHPVYHQAEVRRVIGNAVVWAAQGSLPAYTTFPTTLQSPAGWFEAQAARV
jgi:trehalose utilization protein